MEEFESKILKPGFEKDGGYSLPLEYITHEKERVIKINDLIEERNKFLVEMNNVEKIWEQMPVSPGRIAELKDEIKSIKKTSNQVRNSKKKQAKDNIELLKTMHIDFTLILKKFHSKIVE